MRDTALVTIEAVGALGDGRATVNGQDIFVPGALPGDRVEVMLRAHRGRGPVVERWTMVEAGSGHQVPPCPHAGPCGGCTLQHMAPDIYQAWAARRLLDPLGQQGVDPAVVLPAVFSPPQSRRRLALKARRVKSGVLLGLNAGRSHQIVDMTSCSVAHPALTALFDPLRTVLAKILPGGTRANVALTVTNSGVDCVFDSAAVLDLGAREALADFAERYDIAALHWRDADFLDPIAIRRHPILTCGPVGVGIPPGAFVQATETGQQALSTDCLEALEGAARVADLFAGVGTFTFPLAQHAAVHAVEGARGALDALGAASRHASGLKSVTAEHRDLFRRPLTAKELNGFDGVVIDPPRAGAAAQAEMLAQSSVPTIVSVSCNPATFARDAKLLVDGGYRFVQVRAVDQFLWSPHLEIVGIFRRD